MSTPTDEIAIDLEAADAKAAADAAKNGANGAADDSNTAAADIDVEKDGAQPQKGAAAVVSYSTK